jgi:hypothetical protein
MTGWREKKEEEEEEELDGWKVFKRLQFVGLLSRESLPVGGIY